MQGYYMQYTYNIFLILKIVMCIVIHAFYVFEGYIRFESFIFRKNIIFESLYHKNRVIKLIITISFYSQNYYKLFLEYN